MRRTLPALLLLAGCGRPLPELPRPDLSAFQPDVRAAVERAAADARREPARALELGMVLHAHQQYGLAAQAYARAHAADANAYAPLYYWGLALASDGDYAGAAARLRSALALRPGSVPAKLKLAEVLREAGDNEGSARLAREVLAADARDAGAHYLLARATGDIAGYRQALALFPRYGAAQFALAEALRRRGDAAGAQDALRDYERDKTLDPPRADPELQALRALDRSATALLRRADEQQAEGRLQDAAALAREALAKDPKLVEAHVSLIALAARLGDDAGAQAAYREAISLAPDRAEAHYNYGVFRFERGDAVEAAKAFGKAVAAQPRHAEALHNLAVIAERQGALDRAAAFYRRALDARPVYPQAWFHLGRVYANQRRLADAIAALERSLEPESDSTPAYRYALGAVHARKGDKVRAAQILRAARDQAQARGQAALVAAIDRDLANL